MNRLRWCDRTSAGREAARPGYCQAVELGGYERMEAQEIIHDLRNALGLMINYATLAADGLADRPGVREDLRQICDAGQRAAELVGQLSTVIDAAEVQSGDQSR